MFKKILLVLGVLFLGLLTNLWLYQITQTITTSGDFKTPDPRAPEICSLIHYKITVSAGILIKSSFSTSTAGSTCLYAVIPQTQSFWQKVFDHNIFRFMKTWQFYANWFIYSSAWAGLLYIVKKNHANYRH